MDLELLKEKFLYKLEDFLEINGIEYTKQRNRVTFPCPLHDSDNIDSLSIYTENAKVKGIWRCWTHHCESEIQDDGKRLGKGIFGFIRGMLMRKRGRYVSYSEAIKYVCHFVGAEYDNKPMDEESLDLMRFNKQVKCINHTLNSNKKTVDRNQVRRFLRIPAEYYLKRGYKEETLDKFDVGFYPYEGRQMSNRIFVPVYDVDGRYLIGGVGRSIYDQCALCDYYHDKSKPCPKTRVQEYKCSKWINSNGFYSGSCLYNYWNAKDHILDSNTIILVEGQGDVWRLEEAGITNSVGMFGDSLTDEQLILLEKSGALTVVVATDPDEAGNKAKEKIREQCYPYYHVHFIDLVDKDVGDMDIEEARETFQKFM